MRFKKRCYWPELRTYWGCCKLSTGIYIRSSITVLMFGVLAVLVTSNIVRLLKKSNEFLKTTNKTEIEANLNVDDIHFDLDRVVLYYQTLIIFYIFWAVFKALYAIKTLLLCYSIYKNKPTLMKVCLYIAMPSCFFDLVLSITAFFLFMHWLRVFLVIFYISEVYNFLAIYSEHKRITGTSKIISSEDIGEPNVEQICSNDYYQFNRPHCRSCSCFVSDDISPTSENSELQIHINRSVSSVNYVNNIRNVQNEPVNNDSSSSTNDRNRYRPERPNYLALNLDAREEKVDIADTPVIYDEEQLNVCGSPIVENR